MPTQNARDVARTILAAHGLSTSHFGLRFDRVVERVLGDLNAFVEAVAGFEGTVLVSITAPIRLPARTVANLKTEIQGLIGSDPPQGGWTSEVNGNQVRLRLLEGASVGAPKFIGFVQAPGFAWEPLFHFAERPGAANFR